MVGIFFSHAQEDFYHVKAIVDPLEEAGFPCWYYERDSLAGQSYLVQIHQAICQCDALVVLISENSLKSHHVTREIEIAYRCDKPFIPIAIKVSSAQIDARQPIWASAFGTTVRIALDSPMKTVLLRVSQALSGLSINKMRIERSKQSPIRIATKPELGGTPHWASDGIQIDVSDLKTVVLRTPIVDQFISSNQKLFVCGTKGIGKTLLLKYKRHLLSDLHTNNGRADAIFIPEDRPYLDMMSDLPTLSQKHHDFLRDLRNCKRLWAFSIRFSVISHIRQLASEVVKFGQSHLPDIYKLWLHSSPVEPTVVFKHMLTDAVTTINSRLDRLDGVLDHATRNVNQAVYVFIDKVDQGINDLPRQAWCNIQGGLLEAAWDCSGTNAHIKIFGTIRDEAYANYGSAIKSNVRAGVVQLRYSSIDLKHLIESLTKAYEGISDFSQFVGLSTVRNTRAEIVEESFAYVTRHTVGRPRDLVHICSALSEAGESISESHFRQIVNGESASNVVLNLFSEMDAFLKVLKSPDDRARFFSVLPYNIMTNEEVLALTKQFTDDDESLDPFLELWTCGLIGTVDENVVENACVQAFKQPHDQFRFDVRRLPKSKFYLLHPSLQMIVKQQRAADGYSVFRFVVVGNAYPWHHYDDLLIDIQRELFELPADDECRLAIESGLPYIHAACSENRDIDYFFPKECRETFEQKVLQAEQSGQHALCETIRKAWVNWGTAKSHLGDPSSCQPNHRNQRSEPI